MPSFDAVSKVDLQEVKNALDQVQREITQRYDFKGTKASIELKDDKQITIIADDKMRLNSLQEMLKLKMSKRGVSHKLLKFNDPVPAASDTLRQVVDVKDGLTDEELKKLSKLIKASGLKVSAQIQAQQLRVIGKKRDDLQTAIAYLTKEAADLELQFNNFRE